MKKQLPIVLTCFGVVPFLIVISLVVGGVTALPVVGPSYHVLVSYGLVIAVFLAGSHWGQQFSVPEPWPILLALSSNVVTLVVWFGYLALSAYHFIFLLSLNFLALLLIDYLLYRIGCIERFYYLTRCIITSLVILTLVVARRIA